jgi:phospholipid-binding lipoprotein MlaA
VTFPRPFHWPFNASLRAVFLTGVLVLGGCATVPPASDVEARAEFDRLNDPLEPMNRTIHKINQGLDRAIIEPIAITYNFVIIKPIRELITNIFRNLQEPLTLVNDILQGEVKRAGTTLGRFVTNTTLGIGGTFDIASGMKMHRHTEDFGQTLGAWGIKEGPYLVVPFLGPSTIRDGVGQVVDIYLNPVAIGIRQADVKGLGLIYTGARALDSRARNIETLRELENSSIDLYATMRSAYRQNRRKEVRNGAPPDFENNFDIFDDFDAFDDEEQDP